jgi:hypothetical protein
MIISVECWVALCSNATSLKSGNPKSVSGSPTYKYFYLTRVIKERYSLLPVPSFLFPIFKSEGSYAEGRRGKGKGGKGKSSEFKTSSTHNS